LPLLPSLSLFLSLCQPYLTPTQKGSYATEPTSTLVLTSPGSKYLDIRILKPPTASDPTLPNEGGPMSRLEWAFAGTTRSSTVPTSDYGPQPTHIRHSIWEHWVDSRVAWGAPLVADEGDMYPQADGRTLELGTMVNPATGVLTAYEEMWRDVAAVATGADKVKYCVVITMDDPVNRARGMVARIGQWCQGLLKIGDETTVERWEYVAGGTKEGEVAEGDWTRCVRLGQRFLPCAAAFKAEELAPGSVVKHGEMVWVVQEKYEWTE
jgi:hypothetical protein